MRPMEEAIEFVKSSANKPVLGTSIVNHFRMIGLSDHTCAGSVGSAVKFGYIRVIGTRKIGNKIVNLFV